MGDLFEIKHTLSFNKDRLTKGQEYDYVTRTSQNQGILQTTGFVNEENINPSGTWSLGLLQMDFFYRPKPWYAGQFMRKISPKIELSPNGILFFSTILNKLKLELLKVLVRDVDECFRNYKVQLPIKNENLPLTIENIDFDFMENFVAELEAERIAELEAYLLASGLKDTVLSDNEKQVFQTFLDGKIVWKKFKMSDLFEIKSYKKRFDANKTKILDCGYPYVVRTSLNNGLRGYIQEDEQFLNDGNTISFGQDTATMFYQEKPYFTGDKIKILKSKCKDFNKLNAMFFLTNMTKAFTCFSWGASSFNVDVIGGQNIQLPTTQNGKIDFAFMEKFIKAIQKEVIKGVVDFADEKIKATKQAVNG